MAIRPSLVLGPVELAPGAFVVASFHGDEPAPFLLMVNVLALRRPPALLLVEGMPALAIERLLDAIDPRTVEVVVAPQVLAPAPSLRFALDACPAATLRAPGDTADGLVGVGSPPGRLGVFVPDLNLLWTPDAFVAPVRHPVVEAGHLDGRYWRQVQALWQASTGWEDVRAATSVCNPSVVVTAHRVVLRADQLHDAVAGTQCGGPPVAPPLEVEQALACLHERQRPLALTLENVT